MNQLILLGNVGSDAETHQFENNKFAIRFNIAVTESWKDNQGVKQTKTDWFRCIRYTTSPNLANYVKKGTKLLVTGKASADAYIKDGQAVAVTVCTVKEIQFIDGPSSTTKQQEGTNNNVQIPKQQMDKDPDDSDLPF